MEAPPRVSKEDIVFDDLAKLPLEVRRISALSFTWTKLKNGCSTKELKSICNDPQFWFQKFQIEKLALNDPAVLNWIQLWIGTATQTKLLESLEKNNTFTLRAVTMLVNREYYAMENQYHLEDQPLNSSAAVELNQELSANERELAVQIKSVLELEGVELNCNFGVEILRKRIEKVTGQSVRKATRKSSRPPIPENLRNDYLEFEIPRLDEELYIPKSEQSTNKRDDDESDEGERSDDEYESEPPKTEPIPKFETYAQYLEQMKRHELNTWDHFRFLEDTTIDYILRERVPERTEAEELFEDYLGAYPEKKSIYRKMSQKKAELLGLHLKTGDILNVGMMENEGVYFVVRTDKDIQLYLIIDDILPKEAFPILLKHKIKTRTDLSRLYNRIEGFTTDHGIFKLSSEEGTEEEHTINGQVFYGEWEIPKVQTVRRAKGKTPARQKSHEDA